MTIKQLLEHKWIKMYDTNKYTERRKSNSVGSLWLQLTPHDSAGNPSVSPPLLSSPVLPTVPGHTTYRNGQIRRAPVWELLSKARLTLFTESNYRIFSFSTQLVTEDYNEYPQGSYSYLENLGSKVDLMANKETSDLSDFCQNHTTDFPWKST